MLESLESRRLLAAIDSDGGRDGNEPSTLTDAAGVYSFKTLAPGSYRVRAVLPGGWRRTLPGLGFYDLTLSSGGFATGSHFGSRQIP